MTNLRNNEQRAKNAIVWTWIAMAITMSAVTLHLISSYLHYSLYETIINAGHFSEETAIVILIVAILICIVCMVSVIIFIRWFRRAYYNLHQKVEHLSFSEGWAAGCWFIPIINFFLPYQIMRELHVKTEKLLKKKGFSEQINCKITRIGWWWALYLIPFIARLIVLVLQHFYSVDGYILSVCEQLILLALTVPFTIITVKIIKDYSALESLLRKIPDDSPNKTPENLS